MTTLRSIVATPATIALGTLSGAVLAYAYGGDVVTGAMCGAASGVRAAYGGREGIAKTRADGLAITLVATSMIRVGANMVLANPTSTSMAYQLGSSALMSTGLVAMLCGVLKVIDPARYQHRII